MPGFLEVSRSGFRNSIDLRRGLLRQVNISICKFEDSVSCLGLYSLSSKKVTIGHKNFIFCEQTLHKGSIDASCNWLQSKHKNRGQKQILRKLRAKIQFPRLLFSKLRNIFSYNPHTILKNARRGRLKNIFIFIYRSSK
jgi:hypothetical protein